jgi:hypothetical protein
MQPKVLKSLASRLLNQGKETAIYQAIAALIGVEFARIKFRSSKGKPHSFIVRSPIHHFLIDTGLNRMSHHAIIGLGIC